MYSSRQTTHSTWRPVYLRRHSREFEREFSPFEDGFRWSRALPDAIGDGDLDRLSRLLSQANKGTDGESSSRMEGRGELAMEGVEIVWYVLTGRRSTRDFGARQRRLRT